MKEVFVVDIKIVPIRAHTMECIEAYFNRVLDVYRLLHTAECGKAYFDETLEVCDNALYGKGCKVHIITLLEEELLLSFRLSTEAQFAALLACYARAVSGCEGTNCCGSVDPLCDLVFGSGSTSCTADLCIANALCARSYSSLVEEEKAYYKFVKDQILRRTHKDATWLPKLKYKED